MNKSADSNTLPELETPCEFCKEWAAYSRQSCPECGGACVVPSVFGKQVLSLLDHNFSRIANRHLSLPDNVFG